ncbi:hypothetical protein [Aurantiacibacter gilvus]|uniref:Lipoprotein n=1 Tax=Aurantiacibacter gilvus TaxID=3139141 RepID=A0ABU9ICK9_9SPHN
MKKLIAVATAVSGALVLAACGGGADEPTEADIDEDAANAVLPDTKAGTYTSTTPEGVEVSVSLNADGTYSVMEGGEQVETGNWEDNIRGTCMMPEGGEGEDCYNIAPAGEDGMVDVTGPDGETMNYSFEG